MFFVGSGQSFLEKEWFLDGIECFNGSNMKHGLLIGERVVRLKDSIHIGICSDPETR